MGCYRLISFSGVVCFVLIIYKVSRVGQTLRKEIELDYELRIKNILILLAYFIQLQILEFLTGFEHNILEKNILISNELKCTPIYLKRGQIGQYFFISSASIAIERSIH